MTRPPAPLEPSIPQKPRFFAPSFSTASTTSSLTSFFFNLILSQSIELDGTPRTPAVRFCDEKRLSVQRLNLQTWGLGIFFCYSCYCRSPGKPSLQHASYRFDDTPVDASTPSVDALNLPSSSSRFSITFLTFIHISFRHHKSTPPINR